MALTCPMCAQEGRAAEMRLDPSSGSYICLTGHILTPAPVATRPVLASREDPETANRGTVEAVLGSRPDEALRAPLAVPPPPARPLNPVRKPIQVPIEADALLAIQERFQGQSPAQVVADFIREFAADASSFLVCGKDREQICQFAGREIHSSADLRGWMAYISDRVGELEKVQQPAPSQSQSAQSPAPAQDNQVVLELVKQLGEMQKRMAELEQERAPRRRRKKGDPEAKDLADRLYEEHVGPLSGVRQVAIGSTVSERGEAG